MKHFSNSLMFYSLIFLFFDRDEMYRNVFYTFIFLWREISLTSKMFYFKNTPAGAPVIYNIRLNHKNMENLFLKVFLSKTKSTQLYHLSLFLDTPSVVIRKWCLRLVD